MIRKEDGEIRYTNNPSFLNKGLNIDSYFRPTLYVLTINNIRQNNGCCFFLNRKMTSNDIFEIVLLYSPLPSLRTSLNSSTYIRHNLKRFDQTPRTNLFFLFRQVKGGLGIPIFSELAELLELLNNFRRI